jgi:hypothetical protein
VADAPLRRRSWRGLSPHDEIFVAERPGVRRRYEFLSVIEDPKSGDCLIEVLGGRLGRSGHVQRNVRVFPPEQCFTSRRERRGGPSPQLSFDDVAIVRPDAD